MNLVRVQRAHQHDFVEAVREGAVRVTTGPLVDLSVRCGDLVIQPSQADNRVAGSCHADVHVQAARWVPVHEVRLIINGEIYRREWVGTMGSDRRFSFSLPRAQAMWLIAEAGWPLEKEGRLQGTLFDRLAPGHVPIGFTNPIWLSTGAY